MKVNPDYKQNLRPLIVAEALRCFRERGIKAARMDDISKGLHVSKRTLYELYVNKEDLLIDVLKFLNEQRRSHLRQIARRNGNVMDILLEVMKIEVDSTMNTHRSFYVDIQKYPKALELLRDLYEEQRKGAIPFFEKGISEGYFLQTIDYRMFMRITANIMDSLKAYTMKEQIPMLDVFSSYIIVLMRGMCTQKGISRIDEFVEKMEN